MLSAAVALLPVLLFLAALVVLDSFKLVAPRSVARTILAGCISAVLCLLLNGWLLDALPVSTAVFARYLAPPLEEALKALPVALLIRRKRVGFLVDAAIHGFAAGAGFALVENVDYLRALPDASVPLWVVRGFGTALLHGTATAIFAILAKGLSDRRPGAAAVVGSSHDRRRVSRTDARRQRACRSVSTLGPARISHAHDDFTML